MQYTYLIFSIAIPSKFSYPDEVDLQRKEALRLRVNEYIKRAEKLKNTCVGDNSSVVRGVTEEDKGQGLSLQPEFSLDCANYFSFSELCMETLYVLFDF